MLRTSLWLLVFLALTGPSHSQTVTLLEPGSAEHDRIQALYDAGLKYDTGLRLYNSGKFTAARNAWISALAAYKTIEGTERDQAEC